MNCPICNKAGLPDYTKTQTQCPQCNSDLKPFLLLHSLPIPKRPKRHLFLLVGGGLFSLICLVLFVCTYSSRSRLTNSYEVEKQYLDNRIVTLKTTLDSLTNTGVSQGAADTREHLLHYQVKKGDHLHKIADFFYGDGNRYHEIAEENNLTSPYILSVGQSLIIKIAQE